MESESGKLNWLLRPLFFIYLFICLFFLFKNNPYLYSTETLKGIFHKEKGEAWHTVPEVSSPTQTEHHSHNENLTVTYHWRQDDGRTGSYDEHKTVGRKYEKMWVRELVVDGSDAFKQAQFVWDDSGFYLFAKTPEFIKTDINGVIKWKLKLAHTTSLFSTLPVLTQSHLFVATEDGRLFSLDKETGRILWTAQPVKEIKGSPVLVENRLFFFGVREENLQKRTFLFQADPVTGLITQISSEDVGKINPYPPTVNADLNVLYIANDNGNLFGINYESGKLLFKTSTSDKILSALLLAEKKVAFTTMDGKLVAVDSRTGNLIWETDLESPSDSTPSFVPTFNYLAVMTNNGYLQAIDFRSGEKLWKFLAHNESPHHNTMTLRLDNKSVEQHEMKWKNKGYVIYAPCGSKRICVYNPDQGRIVSRIHLEGEMASEPIFDGRDFMISVKVDPSGHLKLMRLSESNGRSNVTPAQHQRANATVDTPQDS